MVYENMKFYTFNDFYNRGKLIKSAYDRLSFNDKYVYKLYIYSNFLLKPYLQDRIWEFLNEPIGSCYYVTYEMLGVYVSHKELV